VGGFLLQRNVLHSFAPWAQFRQPEKQDLRYCRDGKRIKKLQRTAPRAQSLNALGTTLLFMYLMRDSVLYIVGIAHYLLLTMLGAGWAQRGNTPPA
jgi:hypothetical protein